MFVILNPSPCVTLSEAKGLAFWLRGNSAKNLTRGVILNPSPSVTLSETKGLPFWLRVNSVKDLMSSFALLRTCFG
jgi:hypothetical protein